MHALGFASSSFGFWLLQSWGLLRAILGFFLVSTFQWSIVCHMARKDHNVAAFFMMLVFLATLGFVLQVVFYGSLAAGVLEGLQDDSGEEAPSVRRSPGAVVLARMGGLLRSMLLAALRFFLLLGGYIALLCFVGFKGWWAFGTVLVGAAVVYGLMEWWQATVLAAIDAMEQD